MKIGIIGAKLQGVETAYLAKKLTLQTIVCGLGNSITVPASGLSHKYYDVITGPGLKELTDTRLRSVNWIAAATEDQRLLSILDPLATTLNVPLLFDAESYKVSSSKRDSDQLFRRLGIPTPKAWPSCEFPIIAKPSAGSGGKNVMVFDSEAKLASYRLKTGNFNSNDWVLQEYLTGSVHSLEVVGVPGNYIPLQVTDLEMDDSFDCMRVTAPTILSSHLVREFESIAVTIAEAIKLKGIMDVEAILHDGRLKVLEIDARIPSQTPTVVYHSTGINILEAMIKCAENNGDLSKIRKQKKEIRGREKAVLYEHVKVKQDQVDVMGERIMTSDGPLHVSKSFFGAAEAVTSCLPTSREWVATLIFTGDNLETLREEEKLLINRIKKNRGKERNID